MALVLSLGLTTAAFGQEAATTAEEVGVEPIGSAETGVDEPVDATEGDALLVGEADDATQAAQGQGERVTTYRTTGQSRNQNAGQSGGQATAQAGGQTSGQGGNQAAEQSGTRTAGNQGGGQAGGQTGATQREPDLTELARQADGARIGATDGAGMPMHGMDAGAMQRVAMELFAAGFREGYAQGAAFARAHADAQADADRDRRAQADMAREAEMRRQVQANLERRAQQQRMAADGHGGDQGGGFDRQMLNQQAAGGGDQALLRLLLGANAVGSQFPPAMGDGSGQQGGGNIVLVIPQGEQGRMLMQQLMQGQQQGG
ncbi:hypothetical protein [Hasllibacter halocynthiae]|nr:hypothetical protein [Hasllibacter halocynthiae]